MMPPSPTTSRSYVYAISSAVLFMLVVYGWQGSKGNVQFEQNVSWSADRRIKPKLSIGGIKNSHGAPISLGKHPLADPKSARQVSASKSVASTLPTPTLPVSSTISPPEIVRCPKPHTNLEVHNESNHGDVCRGKKQRNGKPGKWYCPVGCKHHKKHQAPYCVVKSGSAPCRAAALTSFDGPDNEPPLTPPAPIIPVYSFQVGAHFGCSGLKMGTAPARSAHLKKRINELVGPFGTLLFIGDSTLRYQFMALCRSISTRLCTAKDTKPSGGMKNIRLCGGNDMTENSTTQALLAFDEIAGGSFHSPWTGGHTGVEHQPNGTMQRLTKILNRTKWGGNLLVYTNFGALHLLENRQIGGWGYRGRHRQAPDFVGFMEAPTMVSIAAHDFRAHGAKGLLVMTPHWICLRKVPKSIRKWLDPEREPVPGETLALCAEFVKSQTVYPKWQTRSLEDRKTLCLDGQMTARGVATLTSVWTKGVEAETVAGHTDVATVDAYSLTKELGCNRTSDGRHYDFNSVQSELDMMLEGLAKVLGNGG